jgi:hypothetical protein
LISVQQVAVASHDAVAVAHEASFLKSLKVLHKEKPRRFEACGVLADERI